MPQHLGHAADRLRVGGWAARSGSTVTNLAGLGRGPPRPCGTTMSCAMRRSSGHEEQHAVLGVEPGRRCGDCRAQSTSTIVPCGPHRREVAAAHAHLAARVAVNDPRAISRGAAGNTPWAAVIGLEENRGRRDGPRWRPAEQGDALSRPAGLRARFLHHFARRALEPRQSAASKKPALVSP